MELKSLLGYHELSGVDVNETTDYYFSWDYYEECNVIRFIVDGVVYEAVEDPGDGYRSTLISLSVSGTKVKNVFPPQQVLGVMDDDENNNILRFIDVKTRGCVLVVGTEDFDDYYPCCIMSWHPEHLFINIGR